MPGPSVTVVIPTYNERENLQTLVPTVLDLGPGYRVIVVDDSSPDGTGEIADDLGRRFPGRVEVLHRPRKEGIGRAYVAGFGPALATETDLIAQMDADHSHAPADLARLVQRAPDADLVLGSRYVAGGSTRGWPLHRRLISRFSGLYARLVLGVPIADLTGGFKVYRRETLAALDLATIQSDGYVFQIETTYRTLRSGYRVVEEPITFVDRQAGKSKLSRRIVLEAMVMVWRLRLERRRRTNSS
ncbi:MAG: polyprenol monophosphomannose synthase [Thermomicrobiales bacterium]